MDNTGLMVIIMLMESHRTHGITGLMGSHTGLMRSQCSCDHTRVHTVFMGITHRACIQSYLTMFFPHRESPGMP